DRLVLCYNTSLAIHISSVLVYTYVLAQLTLVIIVKARGVTLNTTSYSLTDFILHNLYSIRQRHNPTFLLRTQLEFDATVLQRTFTHHSTYWQSNEIGIVELDSCSLGTVIIKDFNACCQQIGI